MMHHGVKYPEEKMVVAVSKPLTWEMKPKKTIEEKVQDVLAQADEALKGFTMANVPVIIKKDKPLLARLVTPKPVEKQVIQTIVGPREIPRPLSP